MLSLIMTIAIELSLPPHFVVAIAQVENPALDPTAVHRNTDGTRDLGIMQLNSSWYKNSNWADPAINIRAGCEHIIMLRKQNLTWYETAIAYNCGIGRLYSGKPPDSSISYAARVFEIWASLDRNFANYIGN
jgi:soluble lytic murein transglycosylase-like protein